MKFVKFYSASSAVLIATLMLQRVIWLSSPNPTTHSIGYALTVLMSVWWIVSIVAAFKLKGAGLSPSLPVAWIVYQISLIASGVLLRSTLDSNSTFDAVRSGLMFLGDGIFLAMFVILAKRMFNGSEKSAHN